MEDNPIEDLLLTAFPNTQRAGCPGATALQDLAEHPLPPEHSLVQHVWHCSPCYKDFSAFVAGKRRREERVVAAKRWAGALALCAAAALLIGFSISKSRTKPATVEAPVQTAAVEKVGTLDFSHDRAERGLGPSAKAKPELPPDTRIVAVVLPAEAEAGAYEFKIFKAADVTQPIQSVQCQAARGSDAQIQLRCNLDSPLRAEGSYVAAWKLQGSSFWSYGPFVVRP